MKSSNKTKQKTPPWENPIFLTIMTFVGGYMNGYTYITRNNILAAVFSELVKSMIIKCKYIGDWRKIALVIESIGLFFIGLIPTFFPDIFVTNLVSFFMGYQLCLFKECLGIGFNTTICTGNIRNVGLLLYNVLDEKSKNSIKKLLTFTILTFSFAVGAIPGTLVSLAISTKAVWICSFILLIQSFWINIYENKNCLK